QIGHQTRGRKLVQCLNYVGLQPSAVTLKCDCRIRVAVRDYYTARFYRGEDELGDVLCARGDIKQEFCGWVNVDAFVRDEQLSHSFSEGGTAWLACDNDFEA